jgi:hypothetical protein
MYWFLINILQSVYHFLLYIVLTNPYVRLASVRNRMGFNLPSQSMTITISVNERNLPLLFSEMKY